MIDIVAYNQQAWDDLVAKGNEWTLPVSKEIIDKARNGNFSLVLTPKMPVPLNWYPTIKDASILCLASGGGQQAPIFSALGGNVTVFDNSKNQLLQDEKVAIENKLSIRTVQGDMADLSIFEDASFDLIFHPCSNNFAPDLKPIWKECARILKKGGILMWGFTKAESMLLINPGDDKSQYILKYKMPYSDINSLTEEERSVYTNQNEPLIFGHSLEDQIGNLLANGFQLTDMFEDDWGGREPLDAYFKAFVAARAVKI